MKIYFYLDKPKANSESLVMGRIRVSVGKDANGKYLYDQVTFSTGYVLQAKNWDSKKQKATQIAGKVGFHKGINEKLIGFNNLLSDTKKRCEVLKLDLTTELTKAFCKSVKQIDTNPIQWIKDYTDKAESTKALSKSAISANYEVANKLSSFIAHSKIALIDFTAFDFKFLNEYKSYLLSVYELSNQSVKKQITRLKALLTKAEREGLTVCQDYKSYSTDLKATESTHLIALSESELNSLVALSNLTDSDAKVRDLFVFMCCTGLRASDRLKLSSKHIIDKDGSTCLEIVTQKTKSTVKIPVTSLALSILQKYDYNLPTLSDQYINKQIKVISAMVETLNEKVTKTRLKATVSVESQLSKAELITQHTARRTFGTLAYKANMHLKDISNLLGHSSIQQTERYLKISKAESYQNAKAILQ